MTVRVYKSTDGSAPVLTGAAGSLVALLDAILVNGYGAKTAAGWTIGFTAANKRAYLQNLTGANNAAGMYLYVDDSAPGAGGAREARACGFETMSAITPTGTGQFPTAAQSTIGVGTLVIRKSTTADATARAWTCIANGQTIHLFIETGDIVGPPSLAAYPFIFGDFTSYKTGDQYAVLILGRQIENSASAASDHLQHLPYPAINNTWNLANVMFGHYIARHWTGVGGSKICGHLVDTAKLFSVNNTNISGGTGSYISGSTTVSPTHVALGYQNPVQWFPYPNGPDSSMWLSPIWLNHDSGIRGHIRGLWAPMHHLPIGHGDTYTVAGGNLNGKSMIAQGIPVINISSVNVAGQVHVETSDTWS